MLFHRSLIREFSLIALSVVGVLLAIILTRLMILLLGKASVGEVPAEAVIGLIAFGILNQDAGAAGHRGVRRGAARASRAATGIAR